MAIYRQFHMDFWDDPHVSEYSPLKKLLFAFLFTNRLTSESGIYEISIKQISDGTGIPKQTVCKLLRNGSETHSKPFGNGSETHSIPFGNGSETHSKPFGNGSETHSKPLWKGLRNVTYDSENMVIFIHNFRKRNNTGGNPEKVRTAIQNEYKKLYHIILWDLFFEIYPEFADLKQTFSEPIGKGSERVSEGFPNGSERVSNGLPPNVNDNVNVNVKDVNVKKDVNVSSQNDQNVDNLIKEGANRIKLKFIEVFGILPYPYRTNDRAREKLYKQMDEKLFSILRRARYDPEPFLKHIEQKKSKDVGSLNYFLDSQHGASVWEKLCDQLVFDEHHRIKEKFTQAIDENKVLKMIADKLIEKEQPEWMQSAIVEYKKMVQKYELEQDMTEKDLLRNQILNYQKRFGL